MYFSLGTDGRENVYMAKAPGLNSHVEFGMGIPWDVKTDDIELPFRYSMRVVAGQPPKLYAWFPGSDLMQTRFVDVLRAAGVDNLQVFPTEVRAEDSNEDVPGYVTVNIVGRVSCANVARSTTSPLANVYYFHELVIDPTKTGGLLVFRLDESPMVVLVHHTVATAIEDAGFAGLTLEPVTEAPTG